MSDQLPENLGGDFWFRVFMLSLCFSIAFLGWANSNGYMVGVACLLGAFHAYQIVKRFQKVRLSKALNRNPELLKIYNARTDHD